MDAKYQALLTGDVAAFEALIQQLMSADNAGRKQAESLLEQLKQHSTDLVVGNLIRLMRQSQNPASRDMSAVMLRKVSLTNVLGLVFFWGQNQGSQYLGLQAVTKDSLWQRTSPNVQVHAYSMLVIQQTEQMIASTSLENAGQL